MAATTYTGKQIRQDLATEHGDWVFLGTGVGVSAANYISDTERLQGANLPSGMFDNCIVRIASGTMAGEMSNVDYLDAENGRLYLTPSLTGILAADAEYEIWLKGIDPDVADRLRDNALDRWCSTWRPNPISLIVDGDLEEAGVTNWTAAGGATRTKTLSAFADELAGRWNLNVVVTTALTDYVESAVIPVLPGQRFFLEAAVSGYVTATGAAANVQIIAYDKTNSAAISLGGTRTSHSGQGWGKISLLFTAPANCTRITIRLTSSTATSTIVVGPIAMHRRQATRVSLPDRVRSLKRVGSQYMLSTPSSAASEQGQEFKVRNFKNSERQQVGARVIVNFQPGLSDEACWYWERGYFARLQTAYYTVAGRLAGDAATTDCPLELVSSRLAFLIAEFYTQKYGAEWQDDWMQEASRANYWDGQFGAEPRIVEENEFPFVFPQLSV